MRKIYYPCILFGVIGAYHFGFAAFGSDKTVQRESELKKAESERIERLKRI